MRCEHPGGCQSSEVTKDHFKPRSIGKAYGISSSQLNIDQNIQWLCWPHHREKDKTTIKELEWAKRGGGKPLWAHANETLIFEKGMPKHGGQS